MKIENNPPDAASLMMSARSFGNYDLSGALADLIDNSLRARAKSIWIKCFYNNGAIEVSIVDDGEGMTAQQLRNAMRPASTNPSDTRDKEDLGRFGWGLKSASFSQCRKLTVISKRDNLLSGAVWDLDSIENWAMGILSEVEAESLLSPYLNNKDGTEIIWSKCDRLSEGFTISHDAFNNLIAKTSNNLSLIFHRFLEGINGRGKLSIVVNGRHLAPFDPFHSNHNATQVLETEPLLIGSEIVRIKPYILPHYSKLREDEHERLGGEDGFIRNQGFYVYRNNRLIIHGTWFGLAKFGELSQLVRISVDIPNTLDDMWKITVDKKDAKLPVSLRKRLQQIIDRLKTKVLRVYRDKGGRINDPLTIAVWSRYTKNNEIHYSINKSHPIISRLLEGEDGETFLEVIKLIENNFPVGAFINDAGIRGNEIGQSITNRLDIKRLLDVTTPILLLQCSGNIGQMLEKLRTIEPFGANWPLVEEYIHAKGWR